MKPNSKTAQALELIPVLMDEDPTLSYRSACAKAGISYRTAYRHLGKLGRSHLGAASRLTPKETILEALRKADAELGRPATSIDFHKSRHGVGHMTVYRRFGTFDAARKAAGLEPISWRTEGLPAKMRLTHADLKERNII